MRSPAKKAFRITALVAGLLSVSSVSLAENDRGFYGSINYGLYDTDSLTATSTDRNVSTALDDDGGFGLAFGYRFEGNSWGNVRLEFDYQSFENDAETVVFNGNPFSVGAGTVAGDVEVDSYTINVIQEFGQWNNFTPYAGFGLGISDIESSIAYNPTLSATLQDSDTVLSYQGIAGLDYEITEPLSAYVEYRFQRVEDADLTRAGGGPGGFRETVQDSDLGNNNAILLGLRYNF